MDLRHYYFKFASNIFMELVIHTGYLVSNLLVKFGQITYKSIRSLYILSCFIQFSPYINSV